MTLIPNFLVTGILAVIVGLVVAVWAALFAPRKRGGPVLLLLSIAMLLVGGGFVPTSIGLLSGFAGTRLREPFGFLFPLLIIALMILAIISALAYARERARMTLAR